MLALEQIALGLFLCLNTKENYYSMKDNRRSDKIISNVLWEV